MRAWLGREEVSQGGAEMVMVRICVGGGGRDQVGACNAKKEPWAGRQVTGSCFGSVTDLCVILDRSLLLSSLRFCVCKMVELD